MRLKFLKQIMLASRKLTLPINKSDLVVDVGSGGNPHFRADVSTDMYESREHRFADIKTKGLFLWANAEQLPFKDKVFNFVISSHVLEHTFYPEKMLKEMERIGRSGYIETPSAWQELVSPYKMHCSRITIKNDNILFIKIKNSYNEALPYKFNDIKYSINNIQKFHEKQITTLGINSFFWKNKIKFEVIRDENFREWHEKLAETTTYEKRKLWQKTIKKCIELIYLKRKKVSIKEITCCPKCKSNLFFSNEFINCTNNKCNKKYKKLNGYWDFRI